MLPDRGEKVIPSTTIFERLEAAGIPNYFSVTRGECYFFVGGLSWTRNKIVLAYGWKGKTFTSEEESKEIYMKIAKVLQRMDLRVREDVGYKEAQEFNFSGGEDNLSEELISKGFKSLVVDSQEYPWEKEY